MSAVDHPPHYTSHPSGVECIQITEHMGFNLGNAMKYIWRADEKGNADEDLAKAEWYIKRERERRQKRPQEPDEVFSDGAGNEWRTCCYTLPGTDHMADCTLGS